MLNTVKVVCGLCKPFEGSHRTVFFNLFYTSIILMKFLDKISLHVTGTVIKNRLPEEVKINKTSKIKEMEHGDFVSHRYEYDDTKMEKIRTGVLEG